jgi:hypothetical protein|tara:strand:+ start:482 stop:625 length:144 start_codon:yes stop_codon:yes gene_type:complete
VVSVKTAKKDVTLHTDINAIVSVSVPFAQDIEFGISGLTLLHTDGKE